MTTSSSNRFKAVKCTTIPVSGFGGPFERRFENIVVPMPEWICTFSEEINVLLGAPIVAIELMSRAELDLPG